jgi:hypothetical protein
LDLLALFFALLIPKTRDWLENTATLTRAALLVFTIVPVFVIGASLFYQYEYYELRSLFLAVVVLIPGIMFYLFVKNRKTSLLNEFIANLDRLGLISADSDSDTAFVPIAIMSGRRRFQSYLRKFEAIYGSVSTSMLRHALDATRAETDTAGLDSSPPEVFAWDMAIPIIVTTVLVLLGWFFVLPIEPGKAGLSSWKAAFDLPEKPSAIMFAFLGAYFFSLQMLFRRYVLKDLRPSAYVSISIRIIVAFIGTWVVVKIGRIDSTWTDTTILVIGFAIGVFPPIVWQFVQATFKRVTKAQVLLPSLGSQLPISDLDGLTVWHEARLEEEGIENIPNMATADIVELLLQTRFPADQIIDWVDQAILYTNLGVDEGNSASSRRRRLRIHGIRTASSLELAYALAAPGPDKEGFERVLSLGAGGEVRSPMRALVDSLKTNPNLQLVRAWKGLGCKNEPPASLSRTRKALKQEAA